MKLTTTVAQIADLVNGSVEGPSDALITSLNGPDRALEGSLVAVYKQAMLAAAAASPARCLLVHVGAEIEAGPGRSLIRVDDPEQAVDRIAAEFGPAEPLVSGVHPSAVVDPSARLDPTVSVGPHVVVGARTRIGPRTRLGPGAVVGTDVVIGADAELRAHAVVEHHCTLGDRVLLHPHAVIGRDGFGFRQDGEGRHHRSPQVGTVILGDDVEVGTCATVDRARFDATEVGAGTKIDNHVQISHNCRIGRHVALAGNSSIAGHVTIDDHVMMGGHCAVSDGVHIGKGTRIGGMSMIMQSFGPGEVIFGLPAMRGRGWLRMMKACQSVPEMRRELLQRSDQAAQGPSVFEVSE